MGIPGLTSFIKENSTQYLKYYRLKNTLVIIDGYALTNFLYRRYENRTNAFGGDYDITARVYVDFINLLLSCNVTPIFVFDGAYEQRKIGTVMKRMNSRIHLCSKPIKTKDCMPYFASGILFNILNDMDIPRVKCDFEADAEIIALAKLLNCPVVSQDSDFYMNTVPYIPLDMIKLNLKSTKKVITCQIYTVKKLLNQFGGFNVDYLPLVSALLGNDYINKDTFYSLLGLNHGPINFELKLRRISEWLRKQRNINDAINNMIQNLPSNSSNYIKKQIINIVHDYKITDSKYLKFILKYKRMSKYQGRLKNYSKIKEKSIKSILPKWLEHNYRKGSINSQVMTILTLKKIIFKVQFEDFQQPPYFKVTFNILEKILGLLFENKDNVISVFGRTAKLNIGEYEIKSYIFNPFVPLTDLHKTDLEYRKKIILELIGIKIGINGIPKKWELYIIALIYWAIQTDNYKSRHMHALILSAMTFNIIKPFGIDSQNITFKNSTGRTKNNIKENITKVTKKNCTRAMGVLSKYFQVHQYNDIHLYNTIIHPFAQFQSCIYYFMMLNSLLNFPYVQCRIENFFKGSFLYNLCVKMENCDPDVFVSQQLFDNNLQSLNKVYKSIISCLGKLLLTSKQGISNNSSTTPKPKGKRRKNKKKKSVPCSCSLVNT